jgi:hydrogenase-4 component B
MMLEGILLSIAVVLAGAVAAAVFARSDRTALGIGTAGGVLACVLGLPVSLAALLQGDQSSLRGSWTLPVGELHVGLDSLSAFFLVCIFLVSGVVAIYAVGYLRAYIGKRRLAPALAFFNLLVAAMAGLVIARDGILFLVAWEIMSFASYFLVTYENDREDVRRAGMTYLIASQLGVVFLFVLFALLGHASGHFDFDEFVARGGAGAGIASICFLLAVVGFGTKAGFWPVHIWLPDAHPAAPSHVSALMSGVMIKMGIYGLLRTLTFLGPPVAWWGAAMVGIGIITGIAGVLHALAQHDLKRLLAYHSVENIGIIALGIGVGLLGQSHGSVTVAFLGYAGALLHVLNHGIFKSLLFEGCGAVLHSTGTRNIDSLGGLLRRMPTTGLAFLIGAAAICGLPPLNGFVSEWLIYLGAFRGGFGLPLSWGVTAIIAVPALALIGGLAAACFVKAFGVVFLGAPRTNAADEAHEAGAAMRWPMIVGALLCVAIGVWPSGAVQLVAPAVHAFVPAATPVFESLGPLSAITRVALVMVGLFGLLVLIRFMLLRGREVAHVATWSCGYATVTPRMQYTATSFAEPLLRPFLGLMPTRVRQDGPEGYFPARAMYEEHLGDMAGERILTPSSRSFVRALSRVRIIQQGRIQLYLVYIAITLIVLLIWQLAGAAGH